MTQPAPGDQFDVLHLPRIVAYDDRTTPTGNVTTTETSVFRFDNIEVIDGHLYQITVSNINVDGDTGDDGDTLNQLGLVRLRYAFSATPGTSATTSSTQKNSWRQPIVDAASSPVVPWVNYYRATADGYLSLLWTIVRQGGEGGNIVWFCSSTDVAEFTVFDMGADPGIGGTVL